MIEILLDLKRNTGRWGGGYVLLMMTKGNQAAERIRREAAIVSADNVPAGG